MQEQASDKMPHCGGSLPFKLLHPRYKKGKCGMPPAETQKSKLPKTPFYAIALYIALIIGTGYLARGGVNPSGITASGGAGLEWVSTIRELGSLGIIAYLIWWWTKDQSKTMKELVAAITSMQELLRKAITGEEEE
jgi:hypothetical protein